MKHPIGDLVTHNCLERFLCHQASLAKAAGLFKALAVTGAPIFIGAQPARHTFHPPQSPTVYRTARAQDLVRRRWLMNLPATRSYGNDAESLGLSDFPIDIAAQFRGDIAQF